MLTEAMIGVFLSTLLLAMTGSLWLHGSRSLEATRIQADLITRRVNALHFTSRALRPANQMAAFQTSGNAQWLGGTDAAKAKASPRARAAISQTLRSQEPGQRK